MRALSLLCLLLVSSVFADEAKTLYAVTAIHPDSPFSPAYDGEVAVEKLILKFPGDLALDERGMGAFVVEITPSAVKAVLPEVQKVLKGLQIEPLSQILAAAHIPEDALPLTEKDAQTLTTKMKASKQLSALIAYGQAALASLRATSPEAIAAISKDVRLGLGFELFYDLGQHLNAVHHSLTTDQRLVVGKKAGQLAIEKMTPDLSFTVPLRNLVAGLVEAEGRLGEDHIRALGLMLSSYAYNAGLATFKVSEASEREWFDAWIALGQFSIDSTVACFQSQTMDQHKCRWYVASGSGIGKRTQWRDTVSLVPEGSAVTWPFSLRDIPGTPLLLLGTADFSDKLVDYFLRNEGKVAELNRLREVNKLPSTLGYITGLTSLDTILEDMSDAPISVYEDLPELKRADYLSAIAETLARIARESRTQTLRNMALDCADRLLEELKKDAAILSLPAMQDLARLVSHS